MGSGIVQIYTRIRKADTHMQYELAVYNCLILAKVLMKLTVLDPSHLVIMYELSLKIIPCLEKNQNILAIIAIM